MCMYFMKFQGPRENLQNSKSFLGFHVWEPVIKEAIPGVTYIKNCKKAI